MKNSDTIAAIATPTGEGGIGIIRISGSGAFAAGKRVFFPFNKKDDFGNKSLVYGQVKNPGDGAVIDDGFIVFMKGPHTYTGEDVAELQLHGGSLVLQQVLAALFSCGVRAAKAGEFTRRAFLYGRIDLTQAEAVMDVIGAGTSRGLESARQRLSGGLRKKAGAMSERLTECLARLEAEIEFSEDNSDDNLGASALSAELPAMKAEVEGLLQTFDEGTALRGGVRVLILGRPNVGKSSLLNLLLGEERAIVTHIPGTTRDVIEEAVNIHGIACRLMDTAGLRETRDFVESLGVRAARERIAGADAVLFVFDVSEGNFSEEKKLLPALAGKKVIYVANKLDKIDPGSEGDVRKRWNACKASIGAFTAMPMVFISALDGSGLKALEAALYKTITGHAHGVGPRTDAGDFIATPRQREALLRVLEGLLRAGEGLEKGLPQDLIATDLQAAVRGLKELTGEVGTEDILDSIFSNFCIGK